MNYALRFPLNIQLFADGDGDGGNAQNNTGATTSTSGEGTQAQTVQIDYDKLGDIVSRRTSGDNDKQLKAILKSQYGLSGEELEIAAKDYKAKQEQAKQAEAQRVKNMEQENAQLKTQIQNNMIDQTITTLSQSEGVASEKVPFLLRLVDRTDLIGQDGKVAEDKAKTALKAVLDAFPDFKGSAAAAGVKPLVGGTGGGSTSSATEAQIAAAFGLKK